MEQKDRMKIRVKDVIGKEHTLEIANPNSDIELENLKTGTFKKGYFFNDDEEVISYVKERYDVDEVFDSYDESYHFDEVRDIIEFVKDECAVEDLVSSNPKTTTLVWK